ncbi:LysM peptidoglycan-binding domain-containing protein [Lysinibacillus yapensis]|uniref:LysM peptidoglycan-binding domain-containing protein n=1 Tax=Ureibacillus yapensis TaxID=2304605 RepID=A0A396SH46_9BACL|nr:3D domain-containing protein [Lysinibacillus yapensis]RHW38397.1 LysM peptidoglycan-binding domain-containing protein [Lysinibacillus yapensis]
MKMKWTLTSIMLFIIFSISSFKVYGMENDRALMHTDDEYEQVFLLSEADEALQNNSENKELQQSEIAQLKVHKVKKGDTLYRIAINNGIQVQELMAWNNLSDSLIYPGEELVLEGKSQGIAKSSWSQTTVSSDKRVAAVKVSEKPVDEKRINKAQTSEQQTSEKKVVQEDTSAEQSSGREIVMNSTAYTAYCSGCSGKTATGIDLRSNPNQKVIAVDPNVIPLGSKVWVEGYGEAIAGDTGGAIKGNKIDVFIPTQQQALQWGRKQVKVRILN